MPMRVPPGETSAVSPPAIRTGSSARMRTSPGGAVAGLQPDAEAVAGDDGDARVVGRVDAFEAHAQTLREEADVLGQRVGRQADLGADVLHGDSSLRKSLRGRKEEGKGPPPRLWTLRAAENGLTLNYRPAGGKDG